MTTTDELNETIDLLRSLAHQLVEQTDALQVNSDLPGCGIGTTLDDLQTTWQEYRLQRAAQVIGQ